ncbi:MAG: AMP-binding protein [Bacteroidales bacterium]|nr:AMP-binding protein [Bacteroidales bacterium]
MQKTIPAMMESSVAKFSQNTLVLEKTLSKYESISYGHIHSDVIRLADRLLDKGLQKGDRVALLSEGRSEWLISELALLYLGVINVPLSIKLNEPNELQFRISHSGCSAIIVSNRQLAKIRQIIKDLPDVKFILVFGQEGEFMSNEIGYKDFMQFDKGVDSHRVMAIADSLSENDIANISYTSGTTADPKGIMLSHRNYTANVEQARSLLEIHSYYSSLLILPWDHSFAHTVGLYTLINNGASLSVVELGKTALETLKNIPKNIKETKPTFLLSVPALAKNFKKNIEKGVADKGALTEKLFNHAMSVAYRYNGDGWDKGKGSRMFLKPLVWFYDRILFSKIRQNFGGRLEFFIGGGALLDVDLQRFFYAIGIPMFQGYGLSEAAPIISSNAPLRHKLGSSGFLVKPLELKIIDNDGKELPVGEKGEIVVKGENVMLGYWKNEKATKEALRDGWLYTGDMGYMDNDGFLYVLGRFKSLLIGNDGEKYSPEGIEEALVNQSKYIDQVMLYNNQNNYTVALISPNYQAVKADLKKQNFSFESEESANYICDLIQQEIGQYLEGGIYQDMFPGRWLPAAFAIIPEPFTEENKMVNSTMKVVRGKVVENYQSVIDLLYTSEGKSHRNNYNTSNVRNSLK